jgi:hypothetical protein
LFRLGQGRDPPKPLTDLEEMLLNITGTVVIDEMMGVPELGTGTYTFCT